MQSRLISFLIYSSGVLLFLTAVAKVIGVIGQAKILKTADPVFGIPFEYLLSIVAAIELAVALACFFSRKTWLRASLIAWLSTGFLVYRIWFLVIGYRVPCLCLGNLTDIFHVPPQAADIGIKTVLGYLLVSSYAVLILIWKNQRQPAVIIAPAS